MIQVIKWQKYLLISAVLVILNLIFISPTSTHNIFGVIYLIFFAYVFGNWLFIKNSNTCKFIFGLLFVLTIISLLGTLSFYLFKLNDVTHLITILLIPILLLPIVIKKPVILEFPIRINFRFDFKNILLIGCYLTLIISAFYLLFNAQTDQSIRSPWEILPPEFFFIYFVASLALFSVIIFGKTKKSLILIIFHFFLSFSVALIIYQLGFDYDPFIHRTNENLILATGTLLPKPFYYIGQYSLIIFLHKLLSISITNLDKILVPLLAAVYLPVTIYYSFKDNFWVKGKYLQLIILALLAFPFTNFISTTPQSLANLYLLVTLLLGIYFLSHHKTSFWPLALLALMTLSIHPLAGIPCLFFVALLLFYHRLRKKIPLPKILHQSIFWEIVILASLALPAAFIINSHTLNQLKVGFNIDWLANLVNLLSFTQFSLFYRPFISIHDLVYSYGRNIIPLIIFLIAVGLTYLVKQKRLKDFAIYPILALVLIFNYFFLIAGVSFFNLLSSEQKNYPARVLEMSLYFLFPLILIAYYQFFTRVFEQKKAFIISLIILLGLALTNSFYLSYPRVDKIVENHGYSTSATDLKTVNFLEQLNQNQPYIVLTSQPISAAAINEFGFKHYYNNFYFYPVPTGERLYRLYEDLAYNKEKTADVIATARYLTGVKSVYFVINSYWFDAQEIILNHKESSDHWYAIDGKNFIFEYSNLSQIQETNNK